MKWGLGAVGLGAVAVAVTVPRIGIWLALALVLLALLLFGGYYLWRRYQARRKRDQFTSALEAQTASAPKAISDPNKRAALDKLRQKFQGGLQEFKSRGKDIYKLPWHVIIGESGSGKTEAIRHSGIDFPPGMQDELQGSGGTVNMDWWFTNRGIILDTAGSMLFNEAKAGEAPEWREFLRLLKRVRPQCPINGLFLVLSVESLIKDSADTIAQKASRLAQQLDLIQRHLDVRFPVYLLVTKCDLLTGFREFFDSIEDPLLQHQIFGWSNPEPLDTRFRPELVEENLKSVAARLRRRRLALLRDTSGAGRLGGDTQQFFSSTYQLGRAPAAPRRLDEVDSLFALPESIMRLAPRLRRYLETIFVAGEWSAKPVFLRGIYFTSSMREGKALDEAIALATGLTLDQLPEDRAWEKNKAYFLRDLFVEKVFRESGLVTRATNTLQLLRKRQLAIFGTAGAALLLLLIFSFFAYRTFSRSVGREAGLWEAGAGSFKNGAWTNPIVSDRSVEGDRFAYGGTNRLAVGGRSLTLVEYLKELKEVADQPLQVGWIFKPISVWNVGKVADRPKAQRIILEASVLEPLLKRTQSKMNGLEPSEASLGRHKEALLSLIRLEADALNPDMARKGLADPAACSNYLAGFIRYLMEDDAKPDTNLVNVFARTYSSKALQDNGGTWPPEPLVGAGTYTNRLAAILRGLQNFQEGSRKTQHSINDQFALANKLVEKLGVYRDKEIAWLAGTSDACASLKPALEQAVRAADAAWQELEASRGASGGPLTSIALCYHGLAVAATNASAKKTLAEPLQPILQPVQGSARGQDLAMAIRSKLNQLASDTAGEIQQAYNQRQSLIASLDRDYAALSVSAGLPVYRARWNFYTNACTLMSSALVPQPSLAQWISEGAGNPMYLLSRLKAVLAGATSNGIPENYLKAIKTGWANAREPVLNNLQQVIQRAAGFPLVLGSTPAMKPGQVHEFRTRLQELDKQLQGQAWEGVNSASALRRVATGYVAVADALVARDGKGAAEWDLYFVPPAADRTHPDRDLINKVRYAQVTVGGKESGWKRLDNVESALPLVSKVAINAPVKIAFRKLHTDNTDVQGLGLTEEWAVVRLIQEGKAVPRQDDKGQAWRFQVRPQTDAAPDGKVHFEARLDRPLPRLEDWPKAGQ